eukprot:6213101-Pleurochrysis_carterae.AAC.3
MEWTVVDPPIFRQLLLHFGFRQLLAGPQSPCLPNAWPGLCETTTATTRGGAGPGACPRAAW